MHKVGQEQGKGHTVQEGLWKDKAHGPEGSAGKGMHSAGERARKEHMVLGGAWRREVWSEGMNVACFPRLGG